MQASALVCLLSYDSRALFMSLTLGKAEFYFKYRITYCAFCASSTFLSAYTGKPTDKRRKLLKNCCVKNTKCCNTLEKFLRLTAGDIHSYPFSTRICRFTHIRIVWDTTIYVMLQNMSAVFVRPREYSYNFFCTVVRMGFRWHGIRVLSHIYVVPCFLPRETFL